MNKKQILEEIKAMHYKYETLKDRLNRVASDKGTAIEKAKKTAMDKIFKAIKSGIAQDEIIITKQWYVSDEYCFSWKFKKEKNVVRNDVSFTILFDGDAKDDGIRVSFQFHINEMGIKNAKLCGQILDVLGDDELKAELLKIYNDCIVKVDNKFDTDEIANDIRDIKTELGGLYKELACISIDDNPDWLTNYEVKLLGNFYSVLGYDSKTKEFSIRQNGAGNTDAIRMSSKMLSDLIRSSVGKVIWETTY